MSHHYCTSFGNPFCDYCWNCEQLGECNAEKKRRNSNKSETESLTYSVRGENE